MFSMNPRKRVTKTKKKLVMLTGTKQPREDLRKLVAFHTLSNPKHVLRVASPKRVALETKALQKRFPELGRRLAKRPAPERIKVMEKLDAYDLKAVESGLKKGFALEEMLQYPNRLELREFLKRTTPERTKQLRKLGLNEIRARACCALVEKHGFEKTKAFIEMIKGKGIDPNYLKPEFLKEFHSTGTSSLGKKPEAGESEQRYKYVQRPSGEVRFFEPSWGRMRFVDFKRYGQPLFSKEFRFSKSQQAALARKGIRTFNFNGKMKQIASSNPVVSKWSGRQVFYLEVPNIASLLKEAKPKRQHLKNVLGFADLAVSQKGKNLHILELQSDIARKLGASKEKYRSWAELTILGVAKYAEKNGFKNISLSSPHIIKQVWPHLGKNLTNELYYELPKKMGFELFEKKVQVSHYDSAFGQQQFGKSGTLWDVKVATIKKKFPEFFK